MIKPKSDFVRVLRSDYLSLCMAAEQGDILASYGVGNWDAYDEAMRSWPAICDEIKKDIDAMPAVLDAEREAKLADMLSRVLQCEDQGPDLDAYLEGHVELPDVRSLRDRADRAEMRVADLVELLCELEWCGEGMPAYAHCPSCGGIWPGLDPSPKQPSHPREHIGHAADCRIRAALEGR